MPLFQIHIVPNAAAPVNYANKNNTRVAVPLFGVCNVKVLSVAYHATGGAGTARVIQIRSDTLVSPQSPVPFITFVENASSVNNFDSGYKEYSYNNIMVNGGLTINIINTATGTEATTFEFCVITLQIEELK